MGFWQNKSAQGFAGVATGVYIADKLNGREFSLGTWLAKSLAYSFAVPIIGKLIRFWYIFGIFTFIVFRVGEFHMESRIGPRIALSAAERSLFTISYNSEFVDDGTNHSSQDVYVTVNNNSDDIVVRNLWFKCSDHMLTGSSPNSLPVGGMLFPHETSERSSGNASVSLDAPAHCEIDWSAAVAYRQVHNDAKAQVIAHEHDFSHNGFDFATGHPVGTPDPNDN